MSDQTSLGKGGNSFLQRSKVADQFGSWPRQIPRGGLGGDEWTIQPLQPRGAHSEHVHWVDDALEGDFAEIDQLQAVVLIWQLGRQRRHNELAAAP